jgi:cephalosporin hydroxylase
MILFFLISVVVRVWFCYVQNFYNKMSLSRIFIVILIVFVYSVSIVVALPTDRLMSRTKVISILSFFGGMGFDYFLINSGILTTEKPVSNIITTPAPIITKLPPTTTELIKTNHDFVPDEEGWIVGLRRIPRMTHNTIYNPDDDIKLQKHPDRYARSPVPLGSWKIRVAPDRWLTMDEIVYGYDLWLEESHNFVQLSWLGVHCQQDPISAFSIQDMIVQVKPDLLIELGTNTGGGALFYSTIMRSYNKDAKIITVDPSEVRPWNAHGTSCVKCINATTHPYWNDGMIRFIRGYATSPDVQEIIQEYVSKASVVLTIDDAGHTYQGTLDNIEVLQKWTTVGSYMLVQDTKMDRFAHASGLFGGGAAKEHFGPMRAVDKFLERHRNFIIDRRFEYMLYSQHHRGFLRRRY